MYGGPSAARSLPPLQHQGPPHPPSQIPSQSPPPDAFAFSSSNTYQRFSSPPVQGGSHLHQSMAAHYTFSLRDADKAEKLRQSLPPTLKVNDVDDPDKARKRAGLARTGCFRDEGIERESCCNSSVVFCPNGL